MSFAKYLEGRRRSEAAIRELVASMRKLQSGMAEVLAELLLDLDVSGGLIDSTDGNVDRVSEIMRVLRGVFTDGEWLEAVDIYASNFDIMEGDIVGYAGSLGKVDKKLVSALKRHYKTTVVAYLTDPQSFAKDVFAPVQQNIITAISTNASLKELTVGTRTIIKGTKEKEGAIVSSGQPLAETSATLYERSVTSKIAKELEIELYFYQGRNIDSTRPFCRSRAGHAWHIKEIEAWAAEEWAGKIEGTDKQTIFVYLGGWFGNNKACRHILIPISEKDAPAGDLERMRAVGLIAL